MALLNTDDFRAAARRRLPRGLFDYIDRGTEEELSLARIRAALDGIRLQPRILNGECPVSLETAFLGRRRPTPLVIAPTALAGMVADRGETKLARAASRFGIPFTVSTQSVEPIEDIRRGAPDAELWFQLYVWKDRARTAQLLRRVAECDCETLVLTVDTQMPPKREYNQRNGFGVPFRPTPRNIADILCHPRWLWQVILRPGLRHGMPSYGHYPPEFRSGLMSSTTAEDLRLDPALTWQDLRALRDGWRGRIVLKGVLAAEDALRARAEGVDGIVVSTHGGRNFDCLPTTAEALPRIAGQRGALPELIADSGVRRGSDVLKYIALGALAVQLGRAPLWGLAAGDEGGAAALLEILLAEIQTSMGFLGARRPADLARSDG
ncbi:alpha-hydroxy acid oxidase [Paracoccus siganidrum]|uniref:Alpha-hydroxy-acid oxidizing protein n=1 Tax=Paracoccus siganidrum TaxID=1276757 RepID=A0A419AB46_9RHOB|nr:alpha-hydroxy acid oxidase [Paracoccus siganidrum]RJL20588.1 alpha-hydroxy-acid oxidizing protein [Paracoccus siganidrum]RMC38332.1 alpha-hydroxy-acid oxidizing protein [Paracoccus siganidrum]